jgi:PAS domain-containing protein
MDFLEVNESACKMLGYTKENFTMNVRDLYLEDELSRRPIMFKELLTGSKHCSNGL